MDALILFVLKSIIVTGILCTWYMLALKNKRLHNYNRFFLLFTLYASIQVPLLNFKWSPVYEKPPVIYTSAKVLLHTLNGETVAPQATQQIPAIDWQAIAIGIAALVSLGLLVTMLIRIAWIIRIGKRYPRTVTAGITVVHTDIAKAPFSFMNRIFWRDNISPDTESGRMILLHEQVHIKQKHTYDKLACQLLTCIFWMNPFYWLIQKELGMVHEFIADEQAIINDGIEEDNYTETFAKMLLQVHNRTDYFTPEHQFFSSPIKRRLTMLQTKKTVRGSVLRRAAVLPLVAASIFIFAFSPRMAPNSAGIKAGKKIVLVVDAGHGGKDEGARSGTLVEKDLNLKVAKRIKKLAPGYNIEVHLTRTNDKYLTLEERVAFSNKLHPHDFISVHIDDQPGKETGKGTFDIAINDKNAKAEDSKRLAYAIHKRASRPEWEQKNALSEKNPYVLRENASAAAMIEIGDIKNKEQMQHIEDDAKLDELCSRILEGVVEAHSE
jgi:N-acetylmuramoyl-L-alanine amidase